MALTVHVYDPNDAGEPNRLLSSASAIGADDKRAAEAKGYVVLEGVEDEGKVWDSSVAGFVTPSVSYGVCPAVDVANQFTETELEEIYARSLDPQAAGYKKAGVFWARLVSNGEIDCDDPRFETSLDQLTTARILAAGRKQEILNAILAARG